MATPNYSVDYNDKRFTEVESDKKVALNEVESTYGGMINNADKFYQKQIDAVENYKNEQIKLQNEQTDFAIEQIRQQKDQTKKDYLKEQSGAFVDWKKQSNQYGANAEQMAAQGMVGTGYAESSQVSMYNTYQNRVATARESYTRAVLNYDNAIKDARLQNNAKLAEIAYNALKEQLQLSLEGFQYKNTLVLEKASTKREVDSEYNKRYQDVLAQINTENAMAEEVRQYNEKMAEEKRQYNETLALQKEQLAEEKRQFNVTQAAKNNSATIKKSSGDGGGGSSSSNNTKKVTVNEKKQEAANKNVGKNTVSGADYLNKLIASGASKDKVSNEISIALRNGAITTKEAQKLRSTFTPRGIQY